MSCIVDKLYSIVTEDRKDKYVIAIDALWGFGKTFLAKQLIEKTADEENRINPVLPVFIDLSNYDYINDPLMPFIIEVLDAVKINNILSDDKRKEIKSTIKNVAISFTKGLAALEPTGLAGKALDAVLDANDRIKAEESSFIEQNVDDYKSYSNLLDELSTAIESINDTKVKLNNGIETKFQRVVVFVDNFDRVECRFVFKFLNLIDKITSKNITFCLLMNKKQLEENVYHSIFSKPLDNSESFLNKYVNFEYHLPNIIDRIDLLTDVIDNEFIEIYKSNVLLNGISIRQLLDIQDLCREALKSEGVDKKDIEKIFLLGCFIIVNKNDLIQLWYKLQANFQMYVGTTNANTYSLVHTKLMTSVNMSLSATHDKEGRAFYSFHLDRLDLEKGLRPIFDKMMKILLKE